MKANQCITDGCSNPIHIHKRRMCRACYLKFHRGTYYKPRVDNSDNRPPAVCAPELDEFLYKHPPYEGNIKHRKPLYLIPTSKKPSDFGVSHSSPMWHR